VAHDDSLRAKRDRLLDLLALKRRILLALEDVRTALRPTRAAYGEARA
jgi:hypothetical protein